MRAELLRKRAQLHAEARAIAENPNATAEEIATAEAKAAEIKKIDAQIALLDATAPAAPVDVGLTVPAEPRREEKFNSLGEQLAAVVNFTRGRFQDRRLFAPHAAATGASEGVPADGGFLVQTDFSSELLKRSYETGQLASRVRRIPISATANGLKINGIDETSRATGSRYGGVQAYWEGEADAITATKPKFRKIELNLRKLTGAMYATDELLADASALGALIQQVFPEEFGFMIDDAILNGDGAGKPLGIHASGAIVSVAKEAAQAADTVVAKNVTKMWSRMWPRSRANAIWAVNQEVEEQLPHMTIGNQPVYLPPGGLTNAPFGTLFGRPVLPLEQAAALGDQGDIVLMDPSQYLMIDKDGIQAAASIHVQFLQAEQVFRFIYRVDGQPTWAQPLTPYKGAAANTLSPFVTLDPRA